MNSILQCLLATPELSKAVVKESGSMISSSKGARLAQAYGKLVQDTSAPHATSVAPYDVKSATSKISSQFSGYGQQDA